MASLQLTNQRNISSKREKQMRYLSQAIQLEEAVNPHIIRATMSMISLAILAFILWAAFTHIHEVAHTPGEVMPLGNVQMVQHPQGGVVEKIHVHEGQIVTQNMPLVTLNESGIREDLTRTEKLNQSLLLKTERLTAYIEDRAPDFTLFSFADSNIITEQQRLFEGMLDARLQEAEVIKNQLSERETSIQSLHSDMEIALENFAISNDIYRRRKKLSEDGYASKMRMLEDKQKLNRINGDIKRLKNDITAAETEITEYQTRLASLKATQRDDALAALEDISEQQTQNEELLKKLSEQLKRLVIRAPAEGLVKGLSVNTVSGVIAPGQVVAEIVPLNTPLQVEVKISPRDRGHIAVGQAVQLKFSSYDFSRYGGIDGTLESISATTFAGDQGQRYYLGRISMDNAFVGGNEAYQAMPGMTVMADIITGNKTILQYLLKPIHLSLNGAFTER